MVSNNDPLTNIIKKCLMTEENQRISWEQLFAICDQLKFNQSNHKTDNFFQTGRSNIKPNINTQGHNRVPIAYY
jgi:hypothetical protein